MSKEVQGGPVTLSASSCLSQEELGEPPPTARWDLSAQGEQRGRQAGAAELGEQTSVPRWGWLQVRNGIFNMNKHFNMRWAWPLCLTGPGYLNFRGSLQQRFVFRCFSVTVMVLCSRVGDIKSCLVVFCVLLMVLEIQQNVKDACESFQTNGCLPVQVPSTCHVDLLVWFSEFRKLYFTRINFLKFFFDK